MSYKNLHKNSQAFAMLDKIGWYARLHLRPSDIDSLIVSLLEADECASVCGLLFGLQRDLDNPPDYARSKIEREAA